MNLLLLGISSYSSTTYFRVNVDGATKESKYVVEYGEEAHAAAPVCCVLSRRRVFVIAELLQVLTKPTELCHVVV
jgi:hypothetical protein